MFDEDKDDNGNLRHREANWQIETMGEEGKIAVWGRITSVAQIEILWEGAQRGESKKAQVASEAPVSVALLYAHAAFVASTSSDYAAFVASGASIA